MDKSIAIEACQQYCNWGVADALPWKIDESVAILCKQLHSSPWGKKHNLWDELTLGPLCFAPPLTALVPRQEISASDGHLVFSVLAMSLKLVLVVP